MISYYCLFHSTFYVPGKQKTQIKNQNTRNKLSLLTDAISITNKPEEPQSPPDSQWLHPRSK